MAELQFEKGIVENPHAHQEAYRNHAAPYFEVLCVVKANDPKGFLPHSPLTKSTLLSNGRKREGPEVI